jgi:GcrA cell cycle regulator
MFRWTDEIVDHVASLLKIGATGSQIANEIGVSRSAVISKVNRNKRLNDIGFCQQNGPQIAALKAGRTFVKKSRSTYDGSRPKALIVKPVKPHQTNSGNIARKKASRALDKIFEAPMVIDPDYDANALRLTLTELGSRQCKWEVNNAAMGEEHLFCGRPADDLRSWCPHHNKLALSPCPHRPVYVREAA